MSWSQDSSGADTTCQTCAEAACRLRQQTTFQDPAQRMPEGALSLAEGTGLLHTSLDVSSQQQACSSDSQHTKSSCIALIRRLDDRERFGEAHRKQLSHQLLRVSGCTVLQACKSGQHLLVGSGHC